MAGSFHPAEVPGSFHPLGWRGVSVHREGGERPLIDLVTGGSHGDVHPFVAIAVELQRLGHAVRLFTHPHFAPVAAAAGVPFVAVGSDDYEQVVTDPRLFDRLRGGSFVFQKVVEGIPIADAVRRVAWRERRPAVVVGHPVCMGLRWACEEERVPLVLAHPAPMTLFSRADPVPALQQACGGVARALARLLHRPAVALLRGVVQWRLAPLRAARGLPPQRGLLELESCGGVETLGLWSPAFRGLQPDDPPNLQICGFPWWDRAESEALPDGLEEFLASGPAPLCFSLGSAAAWQPGDFYAKASAASAALGMRALLLTRDRRGVPEQLPAGVFVASYVPFSRVLPQVRAFVHHGGIGTTAQGLRAGVPALVVAHAHDQFHNGVRVALLCAGRLVRRGQLTRGRLVRELRRLLDDPDLLPGARALAAALRPDDGAATAARRISALTAGRP